ncbi:MAG TPA: Gfo/Idh/MocA family oxidoreductase [Capillibacterium sp.]
MVPLRAGIIGCGGIARAKELPAIKATGLVEVVAFCDPQPERAAGAAEAFGSSGAKTFTDYRKLLEEKEIDLIYVCTPNRWHSEISIAALEAGKHVMCEKPMAINAAEARKMLAAAKASRKVLTIAYQNRFRPDALYLKEECQKGTLGEIYFAKARAIRRRAVPTWGVFLNKELQGGGALIDIGSHALDLTLWLMENYRPKYAVGTVYHKLNNQRNTGNAWGDWEPEKFTVEDSAFGFVVMENGATVLIEASWALNSLEVLEAATLLCGTKAGADMFDGLRINGVRHGRPYVLKPDFSNGGVDFYAGASTKPEVLEQLSFINAVLGRGELMVKPEEALVVTEILEAVYQSAATGRPVYFS